MNIILSIFTGALIMTVIVDLMEENFNLWSIARLLLAGANIFIILT